MHTGVTLSRLLQARLNLESKLGRRATLAELAQEMGMHEGKVEEALRFQFEPLSLSEPVRGDSDIEWIDMVEDESAESPFDIAALGLLPREVQRLLNTLNDRERRIVILRFGLDQGEPRTLDEVAKQFALTRERIRQIEARACLNCVTRPPTSVLAV